MHSASLLIAVHGIYLQSDLRWKVSTWYETWKTCVHNPIRRRDVHHREKGTDRGISPSRSGPRGFRSARRTRQSRGRNPHPIAGRTPPWPGSPRARAGTPSEQESNSAKEAYLAISNQKRRVGGGDSHLGWAGTGLAMIEGFESDNLEGRTRYKKSRILFTRFGQVEQGPAGHVPLPRRRW